MGIIELILLGVSWSADAFAVSICDGLEMKKINYKYCIIIALFFGVFQALMPLIGWFLGNRFESSIKNCDHWIAFILLALIGINMIIESFKKEEIETKEFKMDYKKLFLMAIATSIDALAVGVALALSNTNIFIAISIIGIITFAICFVGVIIGHKFGDIFHGKASLIGGIVLILIGLKILLVDLGVLNF